MQVLQVKKYNSLAMADFDRAWQAWQDKGGFNSRDDHPQQALYGFYTLQGNFRQTGYVAFDHKIHHAYWNKTKKGVIADWYKGHKKISK